MITLNSLQRMDFEQIIASGLAMAQESPVYASQAHDPEYTRRYLHAAYDAGVLFGVVAQNGFMIGSVSGTWATPTLQAAEWMLYVAPEHRGSGLAVRLIKRFEELARAKGAKRIIAGSTTGINDEGVRKLYERLGYRSRGTAVSKEL
jgi:GNAT superfamily N-acetyltransferase